MAIVAQGGDLTLDALIRNGAGAPCDATNLAVSIYTLAGVRIAGPFVVPAIVHRDLGQYRYIWPTPIGQGLGTYEARWSGLDNFNATIRGVETFDVVPPGSILVGPLDILVKPEDYDGIRNLLGVTELDVTDDMVESMVFGPHAEILVKGAVGGWAEIVQTDPEWRVLRLATSYATAALIAESAAKGGFIGLVRGEGARSEQSWTAISKTFWEYFGRLVMETGEQPVDDGWAAPWFLVAHSRRGNSWPAYSNWGSFVPTVEQ